jgi:diguanylate cyclase (GGDEF)-like protein
VNRPPLTDQLAVGEPVDLSNCDREPIQIPGSIQPHGVLLALEIPALVIRQVSANCASLLGYGPDELLGRTVAAALGEDLAGLLTEAGAEAAVQPGTQLATIRLGSTAVETRLHVSGGMLLCEFEPSDASAEDQLWFARELTQTMRRFQQGQGVLGLAEIAVQEVRRLTGYDRVMVYRFDPDGHGEVIAEAREARLGSYLGQHYPATDIPRQARALYLRQTLRQIVDMDYEPAAIVPTDNPLTGQPLDLGLAALRSVSPIHVQYLKNMGVQATLTISLKHEGELWGMIACHHYSTHYLSPQVRTACTLIGEVLALQFAREEQADDRRVRDEMGAARGELLTLLQDAENLEAGLDEHRKLLRGLYEADGVAVVLDGVRVWSGSVPDAGVERELLEQLVPDGGPLVSDRLSGIGTALAPETPLCGALAVRLPLGVGEYIVWYRKEWRHELTWGGDPNESVDPDLTSKDAKTLSPRRSFEAWRQAVIGRSRPWTGPQVDGAVELGRELVEQVVAAMRDRLARIALYDPLTGLANRTLLVETLARTLMRRPRGGSEQVGVLFVDLDNFKSVNDAFSRGGGDALLQQTAERLSTLVRTGDMVARLGGDEFVVIMQGVDEPDGVDRAAVRIQELFEAPFVLLGAEIRVTASVGSTCAELGDRRAAEDLIHEADIAMYEAKRRTRGQSVRFGSELSDRRRRRVALERGLDSALANAELHLEYQPILDHEFNVSCLEALARWQSGELGRVGPDEFIPVAEEMGLMGELGIWVLDSALATLADLDQSGESGLSMAVNVSAAQLNDLSLPARVKNLLIKHAIDADRLCLEITEGILIANTGPVIAILEQVRDLGVKIALDDFGTGFSSLAYLRRLPADILKIDRAFVNELDHSENGSDVVEAVVDLARRLNLQTVAEGVETEAQLDLLCGMSCSFFQGYLFSKPLPQSALDTLPQLGRAARLS